MANALEISAADKYFVGLLAIKEGHGEILVRPETGNDKRFRVRDDTIIIRNGKKVTFNELRARDHLQIRYESSREAIEIVANGS